MEFKEFTHKNVDKNGIIKTGGAVHTEGKIIIVRGNCGMKECHCSDGYSITIIMPRTKKGEVKGMIVKFSNKEEMNKILGID